MEPSDEAVKRACVSLMEHLRGRRAARAARKEKQPLFEEADDGSEGGGVFVSITLARMPVKRTFKGRQIVLPHSFLAAKPSICLLVKDKEEMKRWLLDENRKQASIPGLEKIISLEKLRKVYKTFQARRELLSRFDVFVADDRVVCMLPKTLGSIFYSSPKRPLPIRLAQKNKPRGSVAKKIAKVLTSTFLYLSGSCCTIRVGRDNFTDDMLIENVKAAITQAASFIPKKWKGIQSIHIKGETTVALPIYKRAPDSFLNEEGKKHERDEEEEEEEHNEEDEKKKDTPQAEEKKKVQTKAESTKKNGEKPPSKKQKTLAELVKKVNTPEPAVTEEEPLTPNAPATPETNKDPVESAKKEKVSSAKKINTPEPAAAEEEPLVPTPQADKVESETNGKKRGVTFTPNAKVSGTQKKRKIVSTPATKTPEPKEQEEEEETRDAPATSRKSRSEQKKKVPYTPPTDPKPHSTKKTPAPAASKAISKSEKKPKVQAPTTPSTPSTPTTSTKKKSTQSAKR